MSMDDLTLLLIGTEYLYPDSLRFSETGIDQLSPYRRMDLARLIDAESVQCVSFGAFPPDLHGCHSVAYGQKGFDILRFC